MQGYLTINKYNAAKILKQAETKQAWVGKGLKMLGMGLGAAGLGAAGLGAANEGMAYSGMPHFKLDDDPMWSPSLQGVRTQNDPHLLSQVGQFFKRPIQYMTGSSEIPEFHDVVNNYGNIKLGPDSIRGAKMNPDGTVSINTGGNINASLPKSYQRYTNNLLQHSKNNPFNQQQQAPAAPAANNNGAGPRRALRYGDGATVENVF